MCWSEIPKGIFDSTLAKEVGNTLIEEIESLLEKPMHDYAGHSDAVEFGQFLLVGVPKEWIETKYQQFLNREEK